MIQLRVQGKGLPISHLPPERFVASAFYKFVRHPIYIGYTFLFIAAAILINSFWSLAFCAPLLFVGWIAYALYYEEPILLKRFGAEYDSYRQKVPLLLPFFAERHIVNIFTVIFQKLNAPLNRLANRTILFRFGNALFVTYGALIAVGTGLFMFYSAALMLQSGIAASDAAIMISGSAICGIFFGRFFWWLGNAKRLLRKPLWGIREVGYVSFGDLTGIALFPIIYSSFNGLNLLQIADIYAAGMFLAYALGRIGCLTYGCCYGNECEHDGVFYKNEHSKVIREKGAQRKTRYPTQVFSAVEGAVLFIVLNLFYTMELPDGMVLAFAFLLYPIGRAFIEFYRDRKRYFHGVLTEGHFGCGVMFVIGWLSLFFISPGNASHSGTLSLSSLGEAVQLMPVLALMFLIIFFAAGFHWKEVGRW